jgi:hypothetical protein
MRRYAGFTLLLSLAVLWGCSGTVLVAVPARMDLKGYATLGIVEFASNSGRAVNARATRQFQEQVQAAQPGTRFIELGSREAALAAVGSRQLDADALGKLGERYGVDAIFLGELAYSEPEAGVKLTDLARLEGGVRAALKADISARLVETRTGASVWSNSAWVRRQLGRLDVSAERGVSAGMSTSNPREAMLPALLYHLTHDFRPSSVRQPAK